MAKIISVRGYTYSQIYSNTFGFVTAYPMVNYDKNSVGDTISRMVQDTCLMQKMHTDKAPETMKRKSQFSTRSRREGIDLTTIEPLRPDENYGQILVKKTKIRSGKLMLSRLFPLRLWYYAL